MSRVTVLPAAKQDLIDHYERIARDKVAPADRLLEVARESFERLAQMPGIGRAWGSDNPQLAGVRAYPLPSGYRNYLVFYRPTADGIEVIRVLHGARDVARILEAMFQSRPE